MADVQHIADATPADPEPEKPAKGPVVLKFGAAQVDGASYPFGAVHEVYRWVRAGNDVLVVVSAPEGETDMLFGLAEQMGHGGRSPHLPRLLRIGELRAAAMLALAMERAGLKAAVMDPHEMDLRASGDPHDAELSSCDAEGLRAALAENHVVVAPGFVAVAEDGGLAMLGRGGADYTAAFLGEAVGASRVRLIRKSDGLYGPGGGRYATAGWGDAAGMGEDAPQAKALDYAASVGRPLEVAGLARGYATTVGPAQTRRADGAARPMRVALLGCGTVGGGVHAFLRDWPELFTLTGVLVRNPGSGRYGDVPEELLTSDPNSPAIADAELIVESIGGRDAAGDLVVRALSAGQDVATANKEIYARRYTELEAAAHEGGAELRASASVGGGVPVLEAIQQAVAEERHIIAVEAVTNGTANFVLDEMEAGKTLDEAVKLAQDAGYAEADPTADVDGWDAAAKLSIMARMGLGVQISPDEAELQSLREVTPEKIKAAAAEGRRLRQVGTVTVEGNTVRLAVRIEPLPRQSFLAGARGPENRFRLTFADGGECRVSGLGAGRWPTAEAVFADMLDLHRLRAQPSDE